MSTDNLVVNVELKEEAIDNLNDKYSKFIETLEEKTKKDIETDKSYDELRNLNNKIKYFKEQVANERIEISNNEKKKKEQIAKSNEKNKEQQATLETSFVINIVLSVIIAIIIGYLIYANKDRLKKMFSGNK